MWQQRAYDSECTDLQEPPLSDRIVARVVWLYFPFNLSLREVEEMLRDRGSVVSYETIRLWCRKHGPGYARRIRRKAPTKDDIWHLGDVVVRINGQKCWLWIAVDHDVVQTPQHQGREASADATSTKQGCPQPV